MRTTFRQDSTQLRFPLARQLPSGADRPGRSDHAPIAEDETIQPSQQWLVDVTALARCRAIFSGHSSAQDLSTVDRRPSHQSLLEVPVPYDQFCRTHFTSVRRVQPQITWEDACPVYAIALSAHAALITALDSEIERELEKNWDRVRGQSGLEWAVARSLIADGCSALHRLDPLAMRR